MESSAPKFCQQCDEPSFDILPRGNSRSSKRPSVSREGLRTERRGRLILLLCIREVPSSNFARKTSYSEVFHGFLQLLQMNAETVP